ncbi:MAG: M23 family metallopeptidase, partial [Oscillospiraceae bacterium]|nr:M23 family metallopeptidase [Oscillospiraceae bacterium]
QGQYVNQGDIIGAMGSTGNSTGTHLHFEIRINGQYVDPLDYVSRW